MRKPTGPAVFVLDKDGKTLMPTYRHGKVRRMLKEGKAVAICNKPFTIKITYEPETHEVQKIFLGNDPGRVNLGYAAVREDGKCLLRVHVETRNKEIPKLMEKRAEHRHASRRGKRLVRKRRAAKNGTTMKHGSIKRRLPGYSNGGYIEPNTIINKESKFNNRKREEGWLTPTANQLLLTHENAILLLKKILPITDIVYEENKFDFVRMENPDIRRWEYGLGPLHGKGSMRNALNLLQEGKCLLCGKGRIEHEHHIIPRSLGGSDTIANIAGICECCHQKLHTDSEGKLLQRLSKKKAGLNKKYHHLSVLNQIMPKYREELVKMFPGHVYAVRGVDTKNYRDKNGLDKTHDTDAYAIAMIVLSENKKAVCDKELPNTYEIRQFRRHDRAIINNQPYRTYKLDGKVVAKNRTPAYTASVAKNGEIVYKKQSFPSLSEWYGKLRSEIGEAEAKRALSRLEVKPSYKRLNDMDRALPGSIIIHNGKRYVKESQISGGQYIYPYRLDGKKEYLPLTRDDKVYGNTGLVFV